MPIFIYALVDPNTLEIRYVGKALNILSRYKSHLVEKGSTRKCRWIAKLLSEGKRPIVIELEKVSGVASWESAEQYWIRFYKSLGQDLCNHTIGGDGLRGMDLETREKISQCRRDYNLSNKDKVLAAMRSPERCSKISKALKGKPKSPEHAAKIRAFPQNNPGWTHTSETRKKQRLASLGNQHAKGTKRTPDQIRKQVENQRKALLLNPRKRRHTQSDESNVKRSQTLKGRPKSEEWKEKIRQGSLKRWQNPEQRRMQSLRMKARSEKSELKGD